MVCGQLLHFSAFFAQSDDHGYERAAAAFQAGNLAEAERGLREALRLHPRDARVLSLLGIVLDNLKRFEEAEAYYKTALAVVPDSPALLNNLGNHYLARGLQSQGEAIFRRVVARDPDHVNANLQLAKIHVARKEGAAALLCLRHLPAAERSEPVTQLLQAESLYLAGQKSAAQTIVGDLAKKAESDPRLAFSLGMTFVAWERFEDAERAFTLALRASPTDLDILHNLGLASLRAGHPERAAEIFQTALRQRPDDVDALVGLARTDAQQSKYGSAAALLLQAQKLNPQRHDIPLLLAQCSDKLAFYQDAAAAYEQYLKLKPGDDRSRRERAFMLLRAGKQREGLDGLQGYVQKHPEDAVGFYELALAEWNHDSAKTLQHLTHALKVDPNLLAARFARSVLRYEQNQPQESIGDLKLILQREPENIRALERLGQAYLLLDDTQEAVAVLERAARLAPADASTVIHYSRALRRVGKQQEANQVLERFKSLPPIERPGLARSGLLDYLNLTPEERRTQYVEDLQKRLASSPEDAVSIMRLGKALMEAGKRDQGISVLLRLPEITSDVNILGDGGRVLLDQQSYAAAKKLLLRACSTDPSAIQCRLDLALAVFYDDGPEAGLRELDEIPSQNRNGDYLLFRSQVQDALGRPEEAGQTLNLAFKTEPTRADLYFQAVLFLLKHEKNGEALELLQKAAPVVRESPQLMIVQAIVFELLKRPEDAKQYFLKIQARWPEWGLPYLLHGIVLQTHLFFAEARGMFETAIALGENDALAYYYLAVATSNASPDDTQTINQAIERALQLRPDDPDILTFAGKNALRRKEYTAAVSHLTAALRQNPHLAEAHYALSAAYRGSGDQEKSKTELELAQQAEQRPQSEDSRTLSIRQLLFAVGARDTAAVKTP